MRLTDYQDEACAYCGTAFDGKRYDARFCRRDCHQRFYSDKANALSKESRRLARSGYICPECGVTYEATRGDQIYCSRSCQEKVYTDRKRGVRLEDALAALRCVKCNGPIVHAQKTNCKYCRPCRRALSNHLAMLANRRKRQSRT